MKSSAGLASVFILLFFIFFNGLQAYLLIERISEAKRKFEIAGSDALVSTLNEYSKIKSIDSASIPQLAWVVYGSSNIEVKRLDSQGIHMHAPLSALVADTIDLNFMEGILNKGAFRYIDLYLFDSLFQKALHAKKVYAAYRIDTITLQGRRSDRNLLQQLWAKKKRKDYPYATRSVRLPYLSNIAIFASFQKDPAFIRNDLQWPMLSFALILLIGNTALVFVYRTIRKQKRINEIKTDFINNMTHEMKTPITIASAGLDALEHHIPSEERNHFYLHTSKKQLRLLNEFVERILDAAVQDFPDFSLKKEKLDLHEVLEEMVRSHAVLNGKPVSLELTGEGPAYILGDRLHLETAFHNMIDNAIKYSGDAVNIKIDIGENHRERIIKIRDNGMGIPSNYIRNIFEKFFRVPKGDAQSVKGFGLGLYYVSNIIKKHSGSITVQSKLQSGTEFTITLPKYA